MTGPIMTFADSAPGQYLSPWIKRTRGFKKCILGHASLVDGINGEVEMFLPRTSCMVTHLGKYDVVHPGGITRREADGI